MNTLSGRRVFVSGGAGVIGRELVALLHQQGARVWVGDLAPRPESFPKAVAYRRGDLNHITAAELQPFAPEFYFHLAASFERSVETPGFWNEGHHNNIALSHHLIDCMREVPELERVVFASSYLVYDAAQYTNDDAGHEPVYLREDDPIRPRNLCGSAKHHHELELEFLEADPDTCFRSVSARIYRSYGLGSRDVISRWVRAALAGEGLEVFREEGCFDYVFARDVAKGLIALATSDAGGVVNLATGTPRSVGDVVAILESYFPELVVRRVESDIAYEAAAADTARLRAVAGYVPSTPLEAGIAEIIAHERAQQPGRSAAIVSQGPMTRGRDLMITSVSRKTPLVECAKRALSKFDPKAKVHGADSDPNALARHFVDAFWVSPPFAEAGVAGLIDHCHRNGIRYVIPTRDGELAWFAQARDELSAAGIEAMVSGPDCIGVCTDKLRFAQHLKRHGLPAIPTAEQLDELSNSTTWVVKERHGSGSRGVHCDIPTLRTGEVAAELEAPVFQPFIRGRETSVDLYRDRAGRVHGAVCRTRDAVVAGESQITTVVDAPSLAKICEEVAHCVDVQGHAILQAIETPDGRVKVIECNARFGGASTLSERAGLESFYWFLLEASGRGLERTPFEPRRESLRLVRHATDRFVSGSLA